VDLVVEREDQARSVTSAEKSVTSPASAPRTAAVAMVEGRVDMVAAAMAAALAVTEVVDSARRLATPAVVTDTCRATAPRARSATTAERSAI